MSLSQSGSLSWMNSGQSGSGQSSRMVPGPTQDKVAKILLLVTSKSTRTVRFRTGDRVPANGEGREKGSEERHYNKLLKVVCCISAAH